MAPPSNKETILDAVSSYRKEIVARMLMQKYLDQVTPQLSDVWRADELYVKIKGEMKYVFALMDDETRFWIAQEVADSKYTHDLGSFYEWARK
jgi:transposase-like protein